MSEFWLVRRAIEIVYSVVIFEPSIVFSLGSKIFCAAGQFVFPCYLSFDQALIQCFLTLHNLL